MYRGPLASYDDALMEVLSIPRDIYTGTRIMSVLLPAFVIDAADEELYAALVNDESNPAVNKD